MGRILGVRWYLNYLLGECFVLLSGGEWGWWGERFGRLGGARFDFLFEARKQEHGGDEDKDARAGDENSLKARVHGSEQGEGENGGGGQHDAEEGEANFHDGHRADGDDEQHDSR